VPNASALKDGQTFTISDGVNSVTFEYEDELLSNGVTQGRFAIPFNPAKSALLDGRYEMSGYRTGESATVIAARIRDAINSTEVQGILKIRADLSDGADDSSVFSTSALINLTGTALVTVGDGLQKPSSDAMPDGLFGTMAALSNTNGSNSLFTFRNTTPYIDPNTGYPEQIHQIRIQLPAGQKFDPISILGGTGNGPLWTSAIHVSRSSPSAPPSTSSRSTSRKSLMPPRRVRASKRMICCSLDWTWTSSLSPSGTSEPLWTWLTAADALSLHSSCAAM
jgi:hypothetical protein